MRSIDFLSLWAGPLIFSSTTFALPQPHANHPYRHHHHHHRTGPYPTATGTVATGTGTGGAAAPTGYYPVGNWTYSGSSGSTSVLSATEYPSAASTSIITTPISESKAMTPTSSNSSTEMIRGVNIGSWLILEPWMASSLFTGAAASAQDQWSYDSTPGAQANLQNHWSTWFTETDVQTLKSYGFNALRIPIGFWAFDNTDTPYLQGAQDWLDKAIGWARAAGMKVLVDCHGSPGSQNGQQHSGHQGAVLWQQSNNLNKSTDILVTMAQKYGAQEYADVVIGIEMVNEPSASGNNSFATSQQWAVDAYSAMKAVVTNPNLVISTHDSFQGATKFIDIAKSLGDTNGQGTFGVDVHEYSLYDDSDNALTQAQHIAQVCGWASDLQKASAVMPLYVGEWSVLTNVCVNPDGTTTAGTSCSVQGCQCIPTTALSDMSETTVKQARMFVEAQLDVFESSTNGHYLWSWGGPGGWSVTQGMEYGIIPNPITDRKYGSQCGSA